MCKCCICLQEGTCVSCLPSRAKKSWNVASQVELAEVPNKRTRDSSTAQHSSDSHDLSTATNSPMDAISSSLPFERPWKRIIKRKPQAFTELQPVATKKFAFLLDTVVANNYSTLWSCLPCFIHCCLQAFIKGKGRVCCYMYICQQANKMQHSHPFLFSCARSTSSMQNYHA